MIHEFDKKFLEQLVSKRQSTESVAVSQRNCEGFELGFHFEDIFKDIEPNFKKIDFNYLKEKMNYESWD